MIQSLDRGLRILDEIVAGRRTLTEMAASLGVHKSTVLRMLATLEQHHFVARRGEHSYVLGRRIADLAVFSIQSRDNVAAADRALKGLVADLGFAGHVTKLTDAGVIVVSVRNGRRGASRVELGATLPLSRSAAGRVHLAAIHPVSWPSIVRAESPSAEVAATLESLEEIRRTGLATLSTRSSLTIAIAMRDLLGRTVAAIGLELDPAEAERAWTYLLEARDRVSRV